MATLVWLNKKCFFLDDVWTWVLMLRKGQPFKIEKDSPEKKKEQLLQRAKTE